MVYTKATPFDLNDGVQSPPMSDHLVRVSRLKQLQGESEPSWSDSELARQCGRTPQQVRAWFSYNPDTKKGRPIGEKLARSLEEKLKLPRYWLDERPGSTAKFEAREGSKIYSGAPAPHAVTHDGTNVPVIEWELLPKMLSEPNSSFTPSAPHLPTFAQATRFAKFVAMPDDSMSPVFQPGDHILFDPAELPRAGDTVLVSIPSGEHFVRTYRPRTAHHWDATPLNGNYEPLSSQTDGAVVAAVMVEHRRYRATR